MKRKGAGLGIYLLLGWFRQSFESILKLSLTRFELPANVCVCQLEIEPFHIQTSEAFGNITKIQNYFIAFMEMRVRS